MSLLKLSLVGLMAYSAIHGRMAQIALSQELTFAQIFTLACDVIFNIAVRIGILLFILALIDYAWQRYHMEQSLKMTKDEVKDEMKSMEGDPKLKARRRQIAMARLREALKRDVPTADVVVTNPTEFAVALRYDPDTMAAPKVVAKGQGYIAARIREIAIANGIPILERKPLARALYKLCAVGQEVPEQYFSAIAEILAYVYELNGKFRQKHFAK
jgi:flagellar biosynthetic protein FlhB